jgi:hypothetical protein
MQVYQSSQLTQRQDVLSLRRRLGSFALASAVNDVAYCLRRLNAPLAHHGESLSAASASVNSEGLLCLFFAPKRGVFQPNPCYGLTRLTVNDRLLCDSSQASPRFLRA